MTTLLPRPAEGGDACGPEFAIVGGAAVHATLVGREREVVALIEATYRLHGAGDSVNPPSYFLRFPDRPSSRIIALPASLGGAAPVDGLKWISSFPHNVAAGIPRASAVLILNDPVTGYPYACLESSIISATRTAASAAAGADWLTRGRAQRPRRVGFVGTGLIARYVHTYLAATGWEFDQVAVHDLSEASAEGFAGYLTGAGEAVVRIVPDARRLILESDLIVFATVAGAPHVHDPAWFAHNPVVLHISLRDLDPAILLGSVNVVDDVEHCLKADTSPHLAEQLTGSRDFLDGTLDDVMCGRIEIATDSPVVFSPFGLGVLDLALGRWIYDQVAAAGGLHTVPDFFHELRRH